MVNLECLASFRRLAVSNAKFRKPKLKLTCFILGRRLAEWRTAAAAEAHIRSSSSRLILFSSRGSSSSSKLLSSDKARAKRGLACAPPPRTCENPACEPLHACADGGSCNVMQGNTTQRGREASVPSQPGCPPCSLWDQPVSCR